MRRGESKTKGLRRGGQTRSVATKAKARAGPKDASTAALAKKLATKARELDETLEREAAASEVLRVISSSPGDLKPVFQAVLENATRLCAAKFGTLFLYEGGDAFRAVAMHNAPSALFDALTREPLVRPPPDLPLGRVAVTKQVAHVADVKTTQSYIERHPFAFGAVELAGYRTVLAVPMLKDNEFIGAIVIYRQEVRPFTDKQIDLVQNFANQAVIATENARLLNELRQRTNDLTESLEQQTATSDVLSVISSSPGELDPVFETMLGNATRICEAKFGILWLYEGAGFRSVALHNAPLAFAQERRRNPVVHPPEGTGLRRLADTMQVAQIVDMTAVRPYIERDPFTVASVELGGYRTVLNVPMLKENSLIGAISIYRQEVRPFADKQIELVKSFARQAVIAIENTRLLNELRESLEQQTATSEVLQVISSSPGELEPVFATILESAVRICGAKFGNLWLREGDAFRFGTTYDVPPAYADFLRREQVFRPDPRVGLGVVARTKEFFQVADVAAEPTHSDRAREALIELTGARTLLGVPMLKDDEVVGVIGIYRQEVQLFTTKQIELVTSFAAQAVIAIENTRLLNELRESLEQQTATADVLSVISSSPGELEPVFGTLLENAVRICEANCGNLFLYEQDSFRIVAMQNPPLAYREQWQREPVVLTDENRSLPLARLAETKEVLHVADLTAERGYLDRDPRVAALVDSAGLRTMLLVPMLKESDLTGAIVIYRQEVRPFSDKQVALVQNFANQAVIAIENARLLNELREALQQQTATADVLKVIAARRSISNQSCKRLLSLRLNSAKRIRARLHGENRRECSLARRRMAIRPRSPNMSGNYRLNLNRAAPRGERCWKSAQSTLLMSTQIRTTLSLRQES
jgi:GAF domain-containing protein